jgi:hypothetical protein
MSLRLSVRARAGLPALAAFVAAVSLAPALALAQASTVRIETRPFYGATVTLEEGVRVFRPLPPHARIVINPGNRTPIHLGLEETSDRYGRRAPGHRRGH